MLPMYTLTFKSSVEWLEIIILEILKTHMLALTFILLYVNNRTNCSFYYTVRTYIF